MKVDMGEEEGLMWGWVDVVEWVEEEVYMMVWSEFV